MNATTTKTLAVSSLLALGLFAMIAVPKDKRLAAESVGVADTTTSRPAPAPMARPAPYWLSQVGRVALYRPAGRVRGVVLFMSGDEGWNQKAINLAKALTNNGFAVAGVSTPAFLHAMETSRARCLNPNFALIALAQDVEHRLGLPSYMTPILAGTSSGATLAYGALALAPRGIYAGGASLGFDPDARGRKPWCTTADFMPIAPTNAQSRSFLPRAARLPVPWLVLESANNALPSPSAVRDYVIGVPQARLLKLPAIALGHTEEREEALQLSAAFNALLQPAPQPIAGTADLPITIVVDPRASPSNLMAVMYSGDGGWAGLDRDLASALAARGVPVVGIDSLQYFWNAKTQAQAGGDTGRIIAHFSQLWRRPKVVLIGYSFGANTLPFIVQHLPADIRPRVARVSMMGLGSTADFQFHLSSWLDIGGANDLPTRPAIEQLRGVSLQCLRGADESDSACIDLPATRVVQVVLPGGHHFDGNAALLASSILKGLQ